MKKDDATSEDVKILEAFNYKQELKRSLKLFSSFAVAFSFISITTGIFTNYQFVIQTGGPAGIWSWAITVAGQLLVALIFAELASIIPVSGYSYQWIKRLSTPFVSWITGWISFCFLILVIPAVDWGLAPVLAGLLGIPISDHNIMMIVMATIVVQVALNIMGVKLATLINDGAVFTETIGIIGLTVFLFIAAFKSHADPAILVAHAMAGNQNVRRRYCPGRNRYRRRVSIRRTVISQQVRRYRSNVRRLKCNPVHHCLVCR